MGYKKILATAIVIAFLFAGGCTEQESTDNGTIEWRDTELTDVTTGETFRISDFEGKNILVESFAVWCPTCLEQQKEMQVLREMEGTEAIHISLNTDPNEDAEKVREHVERNSFDWYFAVAPNEFTQALIDEFGINVVNAPGAPVVLICEDQSARLLSGNVKSAEVLEKEIREGC
ncbi:TlpA family protein disulfide reductase [Methanohalophilus halophilus]|nr:redoxin family protein [Methanohalophilus halophilus]APH38649.1 hypothetical protein BHR79_03540 [Methanohalophilus halophilus]